MIFARFPDRAKTAAMCMAAVQQDGRLLKFVPPELRSQEICEIAVGENPAAEKYTYSQRKKVKQFDLSALIRDYTEKAGKMNRTHDTRVKKEHNERT